ncbi:MAG: hypothetical protein EOM20_11145 [Spartobacteria bacterium]|nr:hypothetical protein [Spartobacteria bacterium]
MPSPRARNIAKWQKKFAKNGKIRQKWPFLRFWAQKLAIFGIISVFFTEIGRFLGIFCETCVARRARQTKVCTTSRMPSPRAQQSKNRQKSVKNDQIGNFNLPCPRHF